MKEDELFDIVGEIRQVKKDLEDLKITNAHTLGGLETWMETTTEYRKSLCMKLDELKIVFSQLPCKERKGWYDSMSKQMNFMWIIIGAAVFAIITDRFTK